jgi:pimeloyl-ACP methyl ester carboxylesterase
VIVYDTFQKVHDARVRHLPRLPKFRLYTLRVFAYDWRGDLTQTAKEILNRLRELRYELSMMPDSDDQIALVGHSTGGLIIRWLMGQQDLGHLVSHVFFCNVPFRGAPKALGVCLTGCDPPGGERMIPIIGPSPNSMRNAAPSLPIVYHLAPSNWFSLPVAEWEGIGARTREEEKAGLMIYAVQTGICFPPPSVKKAPFDLKKCEALALGSEYWGEFVDELTVRMAARAAYARVGDQKVAYDAFWANEFFDWAPKRIADEHRAGDDRLMLQLQERLPRLWNRYTAGTDEFKFPAGTMTGREFIEAWIEETSPWNEQLAAKAQLFHAQSEKAALGSAWAERAYIFYSNTKDAPTTGQIKITSAPGEPLGIHLVGITWMGSLPQGPSDKDGVRTVEQWGVDPGLGYWKYNWLLSAAETEGDSTVPISSQLGFGGPAKVFTPLPGGPKHSDAPNSDFLWDRVIDVLLGEEVSRHLIKADTTNGELSFDAVGPVTVTPSGGTRGY